MNNIKPFHIDTKIMVKIPVYDVFIDEINAWGPIMSYRPLKLRDILNILNRNIIVEFKNKEDEEKSYIFLKQYNALIKKENEKKKTPIYSIPETAERSLEKSLKIQTDIEKKQNREYNPFVIKEHIAPKQQLQHITEKGKQRTSKLYDAFKDYKQHTIFVYDKIMQSIDFSESD